MKPPVSVSTTIPIELAEFIQEFCKTLKISQAVILREAILQAFHNCNTTLPEPHTSYLLTILKAVPTLAVPKKKVRSKK